MNGLLVLAGAFVLARLFFVATNYENFREHTVHFSNINSVAEDLSNLQGTLNLGLRASLTTDGAWPAEATAPLTDELKSLRTRIRLLGQDQEQDTKEIVTAVSSLADSVEQALALQPRDPKAASVAFSQLTDERMPAVWKLMLGTTRQGLTTVDVAQAKITHGDVLALQYGLVGIGLALLAGLGISYGIFDSVIRPIGDMHRTLLQVLSGDFRGVSLPRREDEIGAIGRVIEDIKARSEHVHRLAYYDNLTGLPNRLRLSRDVGEITRGAGDQRTFAVMLIGIDHFSAISSGFGPRYGDEVLRQIVKRIEPRLGRDGKLYRYSGDIFACALRECASDQEIQGIAEDLAQLITADFQTPIHAGELDTTLTVSIGVALSLQTERPDEILTEAEAALLEAKKGGGNATVTTVRQHSEQFRRRLKLADDIRKGIDAKEFEPFYQPVVDVERGVTVGAETLVRWRRANGQIMMPAEFIFVAEESDLIRGITKLMVNRACSNFAEWNAQGRDLRVSFNVSARLVQVGLKEIIVDALQRSGLPPDSLEMEITETVLIGNQSEAEKLLQDLKKLGLRLSLDDFGTGYSSMGYLSRFQVDKIKIDASFVKSLAAGDKQREVVASIVRLANRLNIDVVAEGVETVEQMQQLRAMGCKLMQGWLFAAALPAPDFPRWVDSTGVLLDELTRQNKMPTAIRGL
ncbi:putative bifunctional diguanylate cyclase/phosphodiesterase [Stenotrophobium rhamnosiphilum]|nr:GGDEF domain-containing phosphodiesterase [Stenotrophobium rhamnosiphilum]